MSLLLFFPGRLAGTAADELQQEDGFFVLQEDGSLLRLDSAVDASVSGEVLTATPVLIDGTPSRNTTADEILQEDGFLILQEDGFNLVVDVASGDASVTGETLTVTLTLLDGTATGTANVTGETLTATPTLIDGTATGTANVTGETLTATPVLLDGTVDTAGNATVTGETLVVSLILIDGDVTVVGEEAPANVKRGGDDAPRSHVGIPPKLVKDKKRRKQIERDELEALYDRIQGIEPQTKVAQKALAAVQKAVAPSASELPPAETLDWARIENDLKAAIAIRRAYRIIQDEEDAVIALLLAA